ncbi:GNAT family N-acetyltransferase [Natronogracilivirga saccharolytica]|uniref:GNAT family N-acetyltransferase n=1 Tax=Natronogracilivirga saccharolytica TaxID=2812953 RepID=A0A8J7UVP3_9BACT|nr:GNAT family N-acetyltransferase [Natronogracilivirga saccharolytica]MBP3193670.1 GNAT family N-acetyltransferase [Natronogracilivirga saccharolytica]
MTPTFSIETITPENYRHASFSPDDIADFLFNHLDQFGDPRDQIMKCLEYALGIQESRRGFILAAHEDGNILGTVVVCETGMAGFVPENLLVYIAVDENTRGRGIGRHLMDKAIETADGDVALHVEPDNPARRLYERIGFTSKYLEMRFNK